MDFEGNPPKLGNMIRVQNRIKEIIIKGQIVNWQENNIYTLNILGLKEFYMYLIGALKGHVYCIGGPF